MSGGTGSPIVSGASFDALDNVKSFTFSLRTKRCSWVRLIVRGWGGIAGLSTSWARKTSCDEERVTPSERTAATKISFGYRPIIIRSSRSSVFTVNAPQLNADENRLFLFSHVSQGGTP